MLKRLALPSLLLALAACGGDRAADSEGPALRAHADSVMASESAQLQVYVKGQDGKVTPISQYGVAPEGTTTSYTVVRDSTGTPLILIEAPASPREWNVEYRHYFNAEGRTVFFRRYSGFFDGCEWGMAKELLERSYTATGEVAEETYKLTDDYGSPQDSTRCQFSFHFPYEVYPTWQEAAAKLQLPAATQ